MRLTAAKLFIFIIIPCDRISQQTRVRAGTQQTRGIEPMLF